jgi:hypothetical protein
MGFLYPMWLLSDKHRIDYFRTGMSGGQRLFVGPLSCLVGGVQNLKDSVALVELLIGADAVKLVDQVLDLARLLRVCDEFFVFIEDCEESGQEVWLPLLGRLDLWMSAVLLLACSIY